MQSRSRKSIKTKTFVPCASTAMENGFDFRPSFARHVIFATPGHSLMRVRSQHTYRAAFHRMCIAHGCWRTYLAGDAHDDVVPGRASAVSRAFDAECFGCSGLCIAGSRPARALRSKFSAHVSFRAYHCSYWHTHFGAYVAALFPRFAASDFARLRPLSSATCGAVPARLANDKRSASEISGNTNSPANDRGRNARCAGHLRSIVHFRDDAGRSRAANG